MEKSRDNPADQIGRTLKNFLYAIDLAQRPDEYELAYRQATEEILALFLNTSDKPVESLPAMPTALALSTSDTQVLYRRTELLWEKVNELIDA